MTTAAIFTATGTQGSSVVNGLVQRFGKNLSLRLLTRNPTAPRTTAAFSKYEGKADIDLVKADITDPDSIKAALKGVKVVFANSNSYDDMEKEVPQLEAVIDIAKAEGVELFVWSTLPSCAQISNGRFKEVTHFENKAKIQAYLEKSGLKWASVSLGFFAENVVNYQLAKPTEDGKGVEISFAVLKPETDVAWTWVARDLGPAVAHLFQAHIDNKNPELFGKIWPVASYQGSFKKLGDIIAARTGKQVTYNTPAQSYSAEMTEMSEFYNAHGLYADATLPPPELKDAGAPFSTLEQFVDEAVLPSLKL
ncbi:unnamed protein product [Tilletia controversa]|uniref:NmrA-like domain-containing protein n=3 Tax=Tilletia TaxID=13289 RepID=A0A8X7SVS9_9BASI|nr:hypothetical protein CF336_g5016 [Tilletia laevis]KAE8194819.1 hypothetical protein CF328_g4629 [Tilletia controversa]KAE8258599.1 hypothetical protein A4X03_0g4329 [Tilletia caries]KAE8198689.1 hypothetical protein CF335_g4332 [Tilletia laevis]KAE8245649.1 hypothetical protein A4X06_0g5520 [Tilletia controversa]